jgi:diguanylate cyclase (GGDEF)-like protein
MAASPSQPGAWLRTPEFDRTRLLDMTRRILPATLFASALCALAVFPLLSAVGPILLVPLALGGTGQIAIGFVFPRLKRPERWILAGDCLSIATISWGVALSGGFRSSLVPLLVLPLLAVAGRHTPRVFACFTALTIGGLLLAAAVAVNPNVDDLATERAGDLAALCGAAAIIFSLMRAEWHYRHQSLLDPLTGVPNRTALHRRFKELAAQAAAGGGTLGMIVADIDHFKRINDLHGHDVGDVVLRDVAETLRSSLRTFSLLYRLGGEEFVALLPGLDREESRRLAERLRTAVQERRPHGIPITMSFGVATATGHVQFESIFSAADRCLYEAKRRGRNRVACEPGPARLPHVAPRHTVGVLALDAGPPRATLHG